ncbi:DUF3514 domain-containing protein [Ehrlichia sp. JZT12]
MLIQLVIGIAAVIIGGISLISVSNNSNEKEETPGSFSDGSMLITVAFATVIVVIVSIVGKLICDNRVVKEKLSSAKQDKKRKQKNKLKHKQVSDLKKERASYIVREIRRIEPEIYSIAQKQEELRTGKDSIKENQEVVSDDLSVVSERWMDVKKKRKKKNQHLRQNKVNSSTDNIVFQSIPTEPFSQDFEESIHSVIGIKENVVEQCKESKNGKDLKRSMFKAGEKLKVDDTFSNVSNVEKISASSIIEPSSEETNTFFITSKGSSVSIISRDAFEKINELEGKYLRQSIKPETTFTPHMSYAQKVSNSIEQSLKKNNICFVGSEDSSIKNILSRDVIETTNKVEDKCLKQSVKSEATFTPHMSYAQKVSNSIEQSSKRNNICFVGSEDSSVRNILSRDVIETTNKVEDKYLIQGAKPKASSVRCMSYAEKISGSASPVSEKRNVSFTGDEENTTADVTLKNVVGKGEVKNESLKPIELQVTDNAFDMTSSNQEPYNANTPVQSKYVNSGLCVQDLYCGYGIDDELYKAIRTNRSGNLGKFRRIHSNYCIELTCLVFEIKNDELVVRNKVMGFLLKYTKNIEILVFVLKISLLVNLTTIYGGKKFTNHMRYCATYFYDQSLLDCIIMDIIKYGYKRRKYTEMFDFYCEGLDNISAYEPHSGEFFQKVFDICYDFALVKECEEYEQLVDFIEWSCMIYCGHMVNALCKMFLCSIEAEERIGRNLVREKLKASAFCQLCHNLRKATIHMYHSFSEHIPRDVAGIITVPLLIWRRCGEGIHDIVKNCVIEEGDVNFGVFVNHMILPIKRVILNPKTRIHYMENIKMYDSALKAGELSMLSLEETINPKGKSEETSRFL